jgi:hypothetical protein
MPTRNESQLQTNEKWHNALAEGVQPRRDNSDEAARMASEQSEQKLPLMA